VSDELGKPKPKPKTGPHPVIILAGLYLVYRLLRLGTATRGE